MAGRLTKEGFEEVRRNVVKEAVINMGEEAAGDSFSSVDGEAGLTGISQKGFRGVLRTFSPTDGAG